MLIADGMPTVCVRGGKCWKYQGFSDSWINSGNMATSRAPWAHDFHEDWGLVMLKQNLHGRDMLEFTKDGKHFTNKTLPFETIGEFGCIKIVWSDLLFATGIKNSGEWDGTYIYNRTSDSWRQVQSMPTPRKWMTCGMIRDNIQPSFLFTSVVKFCRKLHV